MAAQRSYVCLVSEDGACIRHTHQWCIAGVEPLESGPCGFSADAFPWLVQKLRNLEDVHIPDPAELPEEASQEREFLQANKVRSTLMVPLRYGPALTGVLGFDSLHRSQSWSEELIALLKIAGVVFGSAIERKRAEEALQASESRYRNLVDNSLGLICTHDLQGTVLSMNPAAARAIGYEPTEVIGRNLADLLVPGVRHLLPDYLKRLQQEPFDSGLMRLLSKSGEHRVWAYRNCLSRETGNPYVLGHAQDVTEQRRAERRSALQYAVTRILAESPTLAEAQPQLLRAICEAMRWEVGVMWTVDDKNRVLRCIEFWREPGTHVRGFEAITRQRTFERGIGLPGRVWTSGQPAWIPDVTKDDNFPRAAIAAKDGLHGAFGFPILVGTEFLGVVEFFSRKIRAPDAELLRLMPALGSQIGQFIERKRAEEERGRLISELQESLAKVRTLSGLLPICANCKKIRDDKGYWNQIEIYIRDRSQAEFTHGICPECAQRLYPQDYKPK